MELEKKYKLMLGLVYFCMGVLTSIIFLLPYTNELNRDFGACWQRDNFKTKTIEIQEETIQLHDSIVANLTMQLENQTNQTNQCLNTITYIDQKIPEICTNYLLQRMAQQGISIS